MRCRVGLTKQTGQFPIRLAHGRECPGQPFLLRWAGPWVTIGMKPLGEGAEGRTQLTLGEGRVEVGAQLPKLLERTPLRRRETV